MVFSLDRTEARQLDVTRLARRLALPTGLLLAFVIAASASIAWLPVLSFLDRTPFQITDPIFHRDLAYYVFSRPVLSLLLGLVNGIALLSLLLVLPLYILRGDLILRRRPSIEPSAQVHLGVLIALLFGLAAARTFRRRTANGRRSFATTTSGSATSPAARSSSSRRTASRTLATAPTTRAG